MPPKLRAERTRLASLSSQCHNCHKLPLLTLSVAPVELSTTSLCPLLLPPLSPSPSPSLRQTLLSSLPTEAGGWAESNLWPPLPWDGFRTTTNCFVQEPMREEFIPRLEKVTPSPHPTPAPCPRWRNREERGAGRRLYGLPHCSLSPLTACQNTLGEVLDKNVKVQVPFLEFLT